MKPIAVVALGGNAIMPKGKITVEAEFANVRKNNAKLTLSIDKQIEKFVKEEVKKAVK